MKEYGIFLRSIEDLEGDIRLKSDEIDKLKTQETECLKMSAFSTAVNEKLAEIMDKKTVLASDLKMLNFFLNKKRLKK